MSDAGAVIHDIGYQRYDGPRLGRRYIVRALYGNGLRSAFGLGRGAKAKIFPWAVVAVIAVTAVVVTALRVTTGQVVYGYAEFSNAGIVSTMVVLFAAVAAPELASRDLRSGVLALYFARPLRPLDYAVAKFAALHSAVFLAIAGPMTIMLAGAVSAANGPGEVVDELWAGLGGYAYAALFAVVVAVPALLIASLVGRRAVAASVIAAGFLLTMPVVGVLTTPENNVGEDVVRLGGLANPVTMVGGVRRWLEGDPAMADGYGWLYLAATAVFVSACAVLVAVRYRRVAR